MFIAMFSTLIFFLGLYDTVEMPIYYRATNMQDQL